MEPLLKRNAEDVEQALFHLMYQFRQINQMYGLMVTEEVKELYVERHHAIQNSKKQMASLESKL